MRKHLLSLGFILLFFINQAFAQTIQIEEANNTTLTPENLIQNYFLGEGVQIISIKYDGPALSVGAFDKGKSNIGLEKGIVLSTGRVKTFKNGNQYLYGIDAPGNVNADNNNMSTVTDVDLAKLTKETPENMVKYTITFKPSADTLRFRYVFASEEYPEYACKDYNDIFGFFISGPGINGTFENKGINIAKIPGADLPVAINNIHPAFTFNNCPAAFSQFYHDNTKSGNFPVYDGFLDAFVAEVPVQPCQTYTIKLIIADVGDKRLDSGVFLDAKSFGTNALKVSATNSNAVEGCSDAIVSFYLPSKKNNDYKIALKVIGGTATQNVDYKAIAKEIIIKAGTISADLKIEAIKDALKESTETIGLEYQINSCKKDTIWLNVRDNQLTAPELGADKTVCAGTSVNLDASVKFEPNAQYNASYKWSPNTSLSCQTCAKTIANPSQSTTYKVIVEDTYGCKMEDSITINIANKLAAPIVDCQEITSNSINFTWQPVVNANAYEVSSNNGASWENPNNGILAHKISGLALDQKVSLLVRAKSTGSNCPSGAADVGKATCSTPACLPPNLRLATVQNESCYGKKDGKVQLEASNGILPYVYNFDNQKNSTGLFTLLSSGKYTTTVTDAKGCSANLDFEIKSPSMILAKPIVKNATCNSLTNGEASAEISGGTPPYQFAWNTGKKDSLLKNISKGVYNLTVTDKNDCFTTQKISVEENINLQLSATVNDSKCHGEQDGSIITNIKGGTAPYVYNWANGNNIFKTADLNNLKSGTYNLTVTDNNGCQTTKSYNITAPSSQLLITVSGSNTVCYGEKGYAKGFATGGTAPYKFIWNNGQKTENLEKTEAGNYFLTVIDAKGCSKKDSISIIGLEEIKIDLEKTGSSCHDGKDGSSKILKVFTNNKTLNINDLAYQWSNGFTTATNNTLQGGQNYTLTATDKLGCQTIKSISIPNPAAIGIGVEKITNATCSDSNNGTATVLGIGGTAPYSYLWDSQSGDQKTANAINLKSGIYTVYVTDAKGCQSQKTVDVKSPNKLKISFTPRNLTCKGDATGKIEPTITGGTAPFKYLWSNNATSKNIENLNVGIFTLSVTDAQGCMVAEKTKIIEPEALIAKVESSDLTCNGAKNGKIQIFPEGGTAPYKFSLNGSPFNSISSIVYLKANVYSVSVRDVRGCLFEKEDIIVNEPPSLALELGRDTLMNFGDTIQIGVFKKGLKTSLKYQWNKKDSLTMSCLSCAAPKVFPAFSTMYELKISDDKGCFSKDNISVNVQFTPKIYVPTGFSPNADGQNDILMIHGDHDIKVLYFILYDRWGSQILETKDLTPDDPKGVWDGTLNGRRLALDTYVWGMEVLYPTGQKETMKGSVMLLK